MLNSTQNNPFLQAALWYAGLGYKVFPCIPGTKKPLTEHGFLDATSNEEQITAWWTATPDANVAIATEGLLIVDIDGERNAWLTNLPDRQIDFRECPKAFTPRGGRHYWFKQPEGAALRCTQSVLGPNVDTRSDGGYIVVPPSRTSDGAYRWQDEKELMVPAKHLPEAPTWIVDALTAQKPETNGKVAETIAEGQRNGKLTSLAGVMRRAGMSEPEIFAGLAQVNRDRCVPPLAESEVARIAKSIATYPTQGLLLDAPTPTPAVPLGELLGNTELNPPIIHGVLRERETLNIIAPPKTGKSWLAMSLGLSVAAGRLWLDRFETIPGNVLMIDNELHANTLANRFPRVAEALQIPLDSVSNNIFVKCLRGELRGIEAIEQFLGERDYKLVILDAFYRFVPSGTSENDNASIAGMYNTLDRMAGKYGCAFVLIHHSTKGSQADKSITDVGAGAGSQARAADTHLILREHAEQGAVVLDAVVRSFPPIDPVCLRWEFPAWRLAYHLDPANLKKAKQRRQKTDPEDKSSKPAKPTWTPETFATNFVREEPRSKAEIEVLAYAAGATQKTVRNCLNIATDHGLIFSLKKPDSNRIWYSTKKTSVPEANT